MNSDEKAAANASDPAAAPNGATIGPSFRESEERYKALVESTTDYIYVVAGRRRQGAEDDARSRLRRGDRVRNGGLRRRPRPLVPHDPRRGPGAGAPERRAGSVGRASPAVPAPDPPQGRQHPLGGGDAGPPFRRSAPCLRLRRPGQGHHRAQARGGRDRRERALPQVDPRLDERRCPDHRPRDAHHRRRQPVRAGDDRPAPGGGARPRLPRVRLHGGDRRLSGDRSRRRRSTSRSACS